MKLKTEQKLLLASSILAIVSAIILTSASIVLSDISKQNKKAEEQRQYLRTEEAVIITPQEENKEPIILPVELPLFEYVQVIDSCGPYFEGECLNARNGPGTDYPSVAKLRNGMVLKVGGVVERDSKTWYKIVFDEWLRYPNRITDDWYISADYTRELLEEGTREYDGKQASTKQIEPSSKRIIISRKEQKLYAYEGDELFMQEDISTGVELTPTPRGTFTIYKKTPSRYMQGPLPGVSARYWDLPGVPWNLYFTSSGAVIHGAYWHNKFGRPASNGCINLKPDSAEKLYKWAELGMKVIVVD